MPENIHKKLISILIVISWITAMGMLIQKYYGSNIADVEGLESGMPENFLKEQWMGLYMSGEKIGYSSSRLIPLESGYKLTEFLKMRLMVMDTLKDMETSLDIYLDEDLKLSSFESSIKSDMSLKVSGRVEGKILRFTLDTAGTKHSRTIELQKVPSFETLLIRELIKHGPTEGRRISMPIIDPTTMSVDDMKMEITGKEPIMSMGKKLESYRIKGNIKGFELSAWVAEDGTILREETALGLTMVKETKDDAMRLGKPSLDIIAETSVPFNLALPTDIQYLKVTISGIRLDDLALAGGSQRLTGNTLEIEKESLGNLSPDVSGDLEEYLMATMTVQATDPEILSTAKSITGKAENTLERARLINDWVFKNIKKAPVISIPSATEVLRTMVGDCNEHTILYTALARASDIPTRIAVGLVYRNKAFYYHAWPEIHINRWVAIDPTFGQFPADASHIRLVTGDLDQQTRLYSIIGRIKFRGLEYR